MNGEFAVKSDKRMLVKAERVVFNTDAKYLEIPDRSNSSA
jgi:hypothetical protein